MSATAMMTEIDLIPTDYRNERALWRTLWRTGIATAVVVGVAAVMALGLRHAASNARADVQRLTAVAAVTEHERAAAAVLSGQKAALETRLALLDRLRAQPALDDLLDALADAAPADAVWFRALQVERLGAIVASAPASAERLLIVEPGAGDRAVRLQVSITAQAVDHAAVAAFVDAVESIEAIMEVHLQRVSRDAVTQVVDFNVSAVADSAEPRP